MTPTNGGSAPGNVAAACRTRRPRNSVRVIRNANGRPTATDATTETTEIQRLVHSASRSEGLDANARQ